MTTSLIPDIAREPIPKTTRRRDRWARDLLLSRLEHLTWGAITIEEEEQEFSFGAPNETCVKPVVVRVVSPRFYSLLAFRGSLGAAESFIAGYWDCDDLTMLVRIMIRNESLLGKVEGGWAKLIVPAQRIFHWFRRNTHLGSKKNIADHYDVSNDFYRLFLDETMTYSCGIFKNPKATLAEASVEKYDRLCRKLQLKPEDHVLEIGTGWGGFCLHAAKKYGCQITTTTISKEQYSYAQEQVQAQGLEDQIKILLQDYRDLTGQYDKLVSIEMIEAVGHEYLDTFFECCSQRLKPEGLMALQAITIIDQIYTQHVRTVDFIKRYIFPGSCLTSVTSMCQSLTRATDLRLFHLEDITAHYATTLRHWCDRFLENQKQILTSGFPEAFLRMWEYYFCYCEGAFAERYIGDVQIIATKPLFRQKTHNNI